MSLVETVEYAIETARDVVEEVQVQGSGWHPGNPAQAKKAQDMLAMVVSALEYEVDPEDMAYHPTLSPGRLKALAQSVASRVCADGHQPDGVEVAQAWLQALVEAARGLDPEEATLASSLAWRIREARQIQDSVRQCGHKLVTTPPDWLRQTSCEPSAQRAREALSALESDLVAAVQAQSEQLALLHEKLEL